MSNSSTLSDQNVNKPSSSCALTASKGNLAKKQEVKSDSRMEQATKCAQQDTCTAEETKKFSFNAETSSISDHVTVTGMLEHNTEKSIENSEVCRNGHNSQISMTENGSDNAVYNNEHSKDEEVDKKFNREGNPKNEVQQDYCIANEINEISFDMASTSNCNIASELEHYIESLEGNSEEWMSDHSTGSSSGNSIKVIQKDSDIATEMIEISFDEASTSESSESNITSDLEHNVESPIENREEWMSDHSTDVDEDKYEDIANELDGSEIYNEDEIDIYMSRSSLADTIHLSENEEYDILFSSSESVDYGSDLANEPFEREILGSATEPDMPLHFATIKGDTKNLQRWRYYTSSRRAQMEKRDSLLHCAARAGDVATVEELVKFGENLFVRNRNSLTPLEIAAVSGHDNVVKVLLEFGAGRYPELIEKAVLLTKRVAVVNALLKSYPNLLLGVCGREVLAKAAKEGRVLLVEALLKGGADANWTMLGKTPLHIASAEGHVRCLSLMLKNGGDVTSLDDCQWTPLHAAAYHNRLECVRVLLEAGADPKARTGSGETPYDLTECMDIQEMLQSATHMYIEI